MVNPEASRLPYADWYRGAVDRFFSIAQQAGITHVRESSRPLSTMADFKRELEAGVADREDGDLATE